MKPAVFLTGATGFLGMEVLARLLEAGDRDVLALGAGRGRRGAPRRGSTTCCARCGTTPRPTASASPPCAASSRSRGSASATRRDEIAERTHAVLHCAASISFDLPLPEARAINVDGTSRVLDFALEAQGRGGLERFLHVSTAYVSGRHEGAFRERQLDTGQSFRNTYEQTKADAEQIVAMARELGPAIARPSIVMGESDSGWTPGVQRPLLADAGVLARAVQGAAGTAHRAGRHRAGRLRRRRARAPARPPRGRACSTSSPGATRRRSRS